MIRFIESKEEKAEVATTVLHDLPEWFGIPEYTQSYVDQCKDLPVWASFDDQNKTNGFIALKQTGPVTAEICVMGVLKTNHRQGTGTQLWNSFLAYAKEHGYKYVQVKTVQMGKYDDYDRTNLFYKRLGFEELEVFPMLWDEWNPCQVYVMYIG